MTPIINNSAYYDMLSCNIVIISWCYTAINFIFCASCSFHTRQDSSSSFLVSCQEKQEVYSLRLLLLYDQGCDHWYVASWYPRYSGKCFLAHKHMHSKSNFVSKLLSCSVHRTPKWLYLVSLSCAVVSGEEHCWKHILENVKR